MPFLGLFIDFIAEMDRFEFRIWQGIAICVFAVAYFVWVVFLYHKNKVRD